MWAEGSRLALLVCGSFNPPTPVHLRMLEFAKDHLQKVLKCKVVEGIISPVSDAYGKPTLASAKHRINMLKEIVDGSSWIRVDSWEASQLEWTRTVPVLRHLQADVKSRHGDEVRLVLVMGSDVASTFSGFLPDGRRIWSIQDVREITESFGLIVINRENCDPIPSIQTIDGLSDSTNSIQVIVDDIFPNQISSTRLRKAVAERRSIKYATFDRVIDYIEKNGLYRIPDAQLKTTANHNGPIPVGLGVFDNKGSGDR